MHALSSSSLIAPQGSQSKYMHGKTMCGAKQLLIFSWNFRSSTIVHSVGWARAHVSELCLESQQTETLCHFLPQA